MSDKLKTWHYRWNKIMINKLLTNNCLLAASINLQNQGPTNHHFMSSIAQYKQLNSKEIQKAIVKQNGENLTHRTKNQR